VEVLSYLTHNIGNSGAQCLRGADFEGGTQYYNRDGDRPRDLNHRNRWYIEYDIERADAYDNRGAKRLVVSVLPARHGNNHIIGQVSHWEVLSNGPIQNAWYTLDHYQTFTQLR
jgi:guanyl-specific ribonuclease Sa